VRKDRIKRPQDLLGKRIGVGEYQLTANVWARALLAEHGVSRSDIVWGLEEPGRLEKVAVSLPPDIRLEAAPNGATLSQMLADGAIDGIIPPRAPSFTAAKAMSAAHLADTSATKVMLPFVEERLGEARALMGLDFWSYGLAPNRHVLDAFLRHHHDEGLSQRLVGADELFHPSTYQTVKV
jgi:4,5-dihydroxyphthalate decarboxylase